MSLENESIFEKSQAHGAIFTVDISKRFGAEYVAMFDDVSRFVAIQIVIQLLLYTMDGNMFPFFSADFLLLILFIVIGVMFYHLVVKRFVRFL